MMFLVWSNEHGQWWRANHMGYTSVIEEAGRYGMAESLRICRNANFGGVINEVRVLAPESYDEVMALMVAKMKDDLLS